MQNHAEAACHFKKWEQLSLKQKFYYNVGYLSKMFSSAYQYCFYCAQV